MPPRHLAASCCLTAIFCIALPAPARAADWPQCQRAKLRQLALQDSTRHSRGKRRSRTGGEREVERLETWLWKHCREYSYELRTLEQSRM